MSKKLMETDKTVVTDFKVQVVDQHLRLKAVAGAQAVRIPEDAHLVQSDMTLQPGVTALMNNVKKLVIVQSWEDVTISLSNASGQILDIPCSGLFIMYGEFDSVEVKSIGVAAKTRISYLYA